MLNAFIETRRGNYFMEFRCNKYDNNKRQNVNWLISNATKKNPDGAELIRGKTGAIYGNLNSILITMKGLPLSYFKDMQEDKKPVFETYDVLKLNLKIAKELIENISPNKSNMKIFANDGFTTATDFADYLVKKGLNFRDAHKKSAKLVNVAEKKI